VSDCHLILSYLIAQSYQMGIFCYSTPTAPHRSPLVNNATINNKTVNRPRNGVYSLFSACFRATYLILPNKQLLCRDNPPNLCLRVTTLTPPIVRGGGVRKGISDSSNYSPSIPLTPE
jgi:hypothetical protein